MTRNPIRRRCTGLVLLSLSLLLPLPPLSAEDQKDLREILSDALYTEEVTRDPEGAARQYEALLSQHDAQRAFAASALFRLAEVRRKQDRKDDAIALYQKLLARFPEATAEARLAQENLAALGAAPAEPKDELGDYDAKEIKRLREVAVASPDLLTNELGDAIKTEREKIVEFLLSQGADWQGSSALVTAAQKGNLAICKLILKQGKPSPENIGDAMAAAIRNNRKAVFSYFLDQGLPVDSPVQTFRPTLTPLYIAVELGDLAAATLLLDHGANIDHMIESDDNPEQTRHVGTPLHLAIRCENGLEMLRLLLKRGAKPDLPTPHSGVTPLHIAATLETPDSVEMVKELLAAGADPKRATTLLPAKDQAPSLYALVTPFEIALTQGSQPKIEAMLAHGASPDLHDRDGRTLLSSAVRWGDRKRFDLLLRLKADPDVADKDGWTPLTYAVQSSDQTSVRALLEAGADPNKTNGTLAPIALVSSNPPGWPITELLLSKGVKPDAATVKEALRMDRWDRVGKLLDAGGPLPDAAESFPWDAPLVRVLQSPSNIEVFEKMIAKGAKLDEGWAKDGFPDNFFSAHKNTTFSPIPVYIRSYLFRKYTLPLLDDSADIRLVMHSPGLTGVGVLAEAAAISPGDSLARLLLFSEGGLNWPSTVTPADRLTIWRKSGAEWQPAHDFPLGGGDPFPAVQSGDVIELVENSGKSGGPVDTRALSPRMRWELQRRISFPVTLTMGDRSEELTLRGDRLIHDPTSKEVPLCSAGILAGLRWQSAWPQDAHERLAIVVSRKGWPEVRLTYPSQEASRFALKPGDHLKLEIPQQAEATMTELRRKRIGIRAAGLPYIWAIHCAGGNDLAGNGRTFPPPIVPSMYPTLFQLLSETQVAPAEWSDYSDRPPEEIPANLHLKEGRLSVLPHPDWSRIRILRLKDDGGEEVIEVDLAKQIGEAGENPGEEDVKKRDLQLRAGDIVELQIHQDRLGQPWKGLSAREEFFFAQATRARVQMVERNAQIRLEDVRFKSPVFTETPAGWLPLPRKPGLQSARASIFFGSGVRIEVTRNGHAYQDVDPSLVFLRDGDQLKNGTPGGARPR